MTRIATIPLQRTLSNAIQKAQQKLADTQLQLNTGKKVEDLAGLGSQAVRTLSTRSLLARQEAQKTSATQLGTTLELYDANISALDTSATELRQSILTAIGTGQTAGLQGAIEGAFSQFRSSLNASDGEAAMFAGGQSDSPPFTPQTLSATIGMTTATAFTDGDVRASARVADNLDVTYGVTASELGGELLSAFRTLAEAGTFGATPTTAQLDALKTAMTQIDDAMPSLRAVNAENGRKQAQVETLATRAEDRVTLLTKALSEIEEADYGQISIDLKQQETVLKASYSVFNQLSELSLANYLR